MKVKIFASGGVGGPARLEEEVNEWLQSLPTMTEIRHVNPAATATGQTDLLRTIITVWYEN